MASNFKIKKPLRTRILVAFLGALLPLFILLTISVETITVPAVKKRALEELSNATTLIRNSVEASANAAIRNHLKSIADKNTDIARNYLDMADEGVFSKDEAISRIREIIVSQQIGSSGYIYCLNSQGIAVVHPKPEVENTDNTQFEFIHDQIRLKEGYIEYNWKNPGETIERPKALYMSYFETLDWIISVSSYRSEFSQLLNPSDFREAVLSLRFGDRGYAYVFTQDGMVLIHPELTDINVFEQKEMPVDFAKEMAEKKSGIIKYKWQNPNDDSSQKKIAVFESIDDLGWIIVSSAYINEVMKPLQIARIIAYGTIIMMLLIAFATALLLSKRITKPVEAMVHQLDLNSQNSKPNPLPVESNDELGRLASEINLYFKLTEEQNNLIREERFRYLSLFETSPDAIFLLRDHFIIDCNPETLELFKGTRDEIIGKSIFELSPATQPNGENSKSLGESIILEGNNSKMQSFEWKHQTINGNFFDAEIRLKQFGIVNNNQILVAFVRDITERKVRDEKLVTQTNFIVSLLGAIPIPVFFKNAEGVYLGCNKAFTDIMGITSEEIAGKTVHQIWPSEHAETYHQKDIELIKNPHHQTYEFQVKTKEGQLKDVIFAKDIYFDDKGKPSGIIGAFVDITEQKETALQLENYKNQLEQLVVERTEQLRNANFELSQNNEILKNQRSELEATLDSLKSTQQQLIQSEKMASLGVLAAGVAHEINNPLNFIHGGVSGISKYLQKHLVDHIDPLSPMINAINEGVSRSSKIVSSLNHYSRTNESATDEFDVNQIMENCLIMLNSELSHKVSIVKQYSKSPIIVRVNEGKMHQAFLNLLQNASHAISEKGSISIQTSSSDSFCSIKIIDTGCGIDKEHIQRVTDPFFTTKDPGKGTGLGLYITNNILQEYNATLDIESEIGKGTTVTITIPTI